MFKRLFLFQLLFTAAVFFFPGVIALTAFSPRALPEKAAAKTNRQQPETAPTGGYEISYYDANSKKTLKMPFEEYIKGVVASEMPASYETEALKAQAVAARSYILFKDAHRGADHPDAAVCTNPSHCKGYLSKAAAAEKWGADWGEKFYPRISGAVEKTAGEYLSYNGETVEAFFFALSNGKTENSEDVWQSSVPYLRSAESEGDSSAPNFISEAEFDISYFNSRLKNLSKDYPAKEKISISEITRTPGGRVKSLKINGTIFKGTQIRSAFSLKSADFSALQSGKKIKFTVKGNGHGVGMSQYGANYLAKQGKTYEDILKHYYSGVEIINK